MVVQRCPEVRQGQQCILEAGHVSEHRADWASTTAVPVTPGASAAVMPGVLDNSRRDELDRRLLAEARARADTRNLRRFLLLIAAAFCILVVGVKESPALSIGTAIVLVVIAVAVAVRGRGPVDLR